jgi:hypothetical protein
MLSGLLSKDNDDDRSEEDLCSLISSTTDLNISVNTDSCIDLRQPLVYSSSSSSESDISCKVMSRDESISPSITDLTNDKLTKHQSEYGSSKVTERSIHVTESEGSQQHNTQQINISGSVQPPVRPHHVSRFKQPESERGDIRNDLDTRQIFTDL